MASRTTLTVLFGFAAVFWCLGLLDEAANIQNSQSGFAWLAGAALLPAVLTTFELTLLLLFAHVRALGRANAAGGVPGGRFLAGLAKATLAATVMALLAGAVLRLLAEVPLGGADDDGWLNMQ